MSENEQWEAVALGTVGAGLGLAVVAWDTAGRQRAPDGRFEIGDRIGFVEVTTDADQRARQGRVEYEARTRWSVGDVAGTYHVWIDPAIRLSEHDEFVPRLIRASEQLPGRRLLDVVDSIEESDPELFDWTVPLVENHRLDVHPLGSSGPPGTVFTTASMPRGGSGEPDPDALLDGLASSIASPWIQKRLDKLARTGDTEQHLFVLVDHDTWEWAPWQVLIDSEVGVPTNAPAVPDHIDGLWLWSKMNRSCIRWLRSSGWAWQTVELPSGISWK